MSRMLEELHESTKRMHALGVVNEQEMQKMESLYRAADPFYSAANMRALEKSACELREGKIVVKTMDELEAME